jgi:hypothetical protein
MGAAWRRSALMVRPPTRRTCRPDPPRPGHNRTVLPWLPPYHAALLARGRGPARRRRGQGRRGQGVGDGYGHTDDLLKGNRPG